MEKIIIGNWKMNPKTEDEALNLVDDILAGLNIGLNKVGIVPPLVFLSAVSKKIENIKIDLGSQDVFWEDKGEYTGEVSADELKSIGVNFVIVGHSERRNMGETSKEINKKIKKCLDEDLKFVLCIGESINMRDRGVSVAKRFVSGELEKALDGISCDNKSLIVAYEPLWAISKNKNSNPASLDEVLEMIFFIKNYLNINGFMDIPVLYGGSINSDNFKDFLDEDIIDGILIGRASLSSESFIKIANYD
jgi:triosephosphate isomerase